MTASTPGARVTPYLDEVVKRIDARLASRRVGIWLFGSAALGDFDARRSDIDIQAVSSIDIPVTERALLASALSHERLPCPARGLEFVLYSREGLAEAAGPAFQLNLNTGADMAQHVSYRANDDPRFWFVLDVAIGREHGRPLAGPVASEVFAGSPPALILRSLRESLAWQQRHDPNSAALVLAACRAWAWAADGRWLSKGDAAKWAKERLDDPAPVTLALARRQNASSKPLGPRDVNAITERAEAAISAAMP